MKTFWSIIILLIMPVAMEFSVLFANYSGNQSILFKIDRSRDADQVYYEANIKSDGRLDVQKPINIYWIKHTEDKSIKPLTRVQNKFGYGIRYDKIENEKAVFQFASFNQVMTLKKNTKGKYKVFTFIDEKEVEVEHLFIQFSGGTYLLPKIGQVEIYAKCLKEGNSIAKIIKP